MTVEQDTPPRLNTFRRFVWETVQGLGYLRALWGRRFVGGALGLMADVVSEGMNQAVYARMPGHPMQAEDSLTQVGTDRGLMRFRGETLANWLARIKDAWIDYPQAGSPQMVLKAFNQLGMAGWPDSWNPDTITLTESGLHFDFSFTVTVPFGNILPFSLSWHFGDGSEWGDAGLYWGVGQSADIPAMISIIRKWKPKRSRGTLRIYSSDVAYVDFVVV